MKEGRLIPEGVNKAGYTEYRRVKEEVPEEVDMSRRGFLFNGGSAALGAVALGSVPIVKTIYDRNDIPSGSIPGQVEEHSKDVVGMAEENSAPEVPEESGVASEGTQEIIEGSEVVEETEVFSESKYFNGVVRRYAVEYESELDFVLEYAQKITKGDPEERTRIEYISQMLQSPGVPSVVMQELRRLVAGLCFAESRFDAARISEVGARGMFQIMPATWKRYDAPEEKALALVEQTEVAGEYFSRAYQSLKRHCRNELDAIKIEFFEGNTSEFEKYFLTPLLINAYNAGDGTMVDLVKWFSRSYGSQEESTGIYTSGEALSKYDVFFALADKGNTEKAVKQYRKHAGAYALKVYGATKCLEDNGNRAQVA